MNSSKIIFQFLFLITQIYYSLTYYIEETHHSNITNSFAFGSCFYGRLSYRFDMFNTINRNNPELWVWLGDAAYADNPLNFNTKKFDLQYSSDTFNKSKSNECKLILKIYKINFS